MGPCMNSASGDQNPNSPFELAEFRIKNFDFDLVHTYSIEGDPKPISPLEYKEPKEAF